MPLSPSQFNRFTVGTISVVVPQKYLGISLFRKNLLFRNCAIHHSGQGSLLIVDKRGNVVSRFSHGEWYTAKVVIDSKDK